MTAAANAIKVVRTAILAMNAAMLANPIALVVAAIAGLVVAFVYLWNNCEGFRKFWIDLWEKVKKSASEAWKSIEKTFSNIGKWFSDKFKQVQKSGKEAMDNVKKWFSDSYKSITKTFSNIGGWFKSKFQSAWTSIKSVFSGWGSFFSGLWTSIKSRFSSIGSSLGTSMGNAVKSGLNKVISAIEKTINKGIGLINDAIGLANKLPGIDVGKVKKLSLPRLAKGGVLEQGQVGILEGSGAEAVVPLERNREWIARVAEDMSIMQAERQPVVSNEGILLRLNRVIELLEMLLKMEIRLDSGALVGELAPGINTQLGRIYDRNIRGNTR